MADSENVHTTQQATSKVPVVEKIKNPKRVAAGKAIAEKNKQAREAQKQKIAEAEIVLANEQLKKAEAAPAAEPPVAEPPVAKTTEQQTLTTTQWLSIISIIVSLAGVYYKREEIKKVFAPKSPPKARQAPAVDFGPPPVKTLKRPALPTMD